MRARRGRSGQGQLALLLVSTLAAFMFAGASEVLGTATVTIINRDGPGEGFNDLTAVEPVGGNPGTTLGEQRLIAFQRAADLWGDILDSDVEIRVSATFDPLECDAHSVKLGQAGPASVFRDFAGAPLANTFYPVALASKLAGTDVDPGEDDIDAQFNSSFGTTCAFPGGWYYGLDASPTGNDSDLVTVVLHELGHGLGFLTFVELATGRKLSGSNDAYMLHLLDNRTGKSYPEMSDAERVSASTATGELQWSGENVVAGSVHLTGGVHPSGRVEMYAPDPAVEGSSVAHWSDEVRPNQLMAPFFTGASHDIGLAAELFEDLGWGLAVAPSTPTPTVTPTPTPSGDCGGDCSGDGEVAINELISCVNIALDNADLSSCLACDVSRDGVVAINELIVAVNNALQGCPELAACPFDFSEDSLVLDFVCVYRGRWNPSCGDEDLEAIFSGDGSLVFAVVSTDPLVGFLAEVTSPTSAELQGWFTDFESPFPTDFEQVDGSMRLEDQGRTLIVDPDGAPFSVGDTMCDFVEYVSTFVETIEVGDGNAATRLVPR